MKKVGLALLHERAQVAGGVLKVLSALLHPLQAKGGRMIAQAIEMVHPRRLLGQGNLPEAHQGDPNTAGDEPRDQFAREGPVAVQGVGCDENVHCSRFQLHSILDLKFREGFSAGAQGGPVISRLAISATISPCFGSCASPLIPTMRPGILAGRSELTATGA